MYYIILQNYANIGTIISVGHHVPSHLSICCTVLRLKVGPWKVSSSVSPWKRFPTGTELLLGAGPHPGTRGLHSCLTAF